MKKYFSSEFDSIYKAIETCNENQDWNVINIYPTGWRQEVCVVYGTLEVKEVDLEKEYKDFVEEDPVYNMLVNGIVGKAIAKHFYELGLKAQKGK